MAKKDKDSEKVELQPLGDRVVVEREESESKTAGGIVLPDTAKDKPARGTVVSVGDGRLLDDGTRSKLQVKGGDRVLFTSYAGEQFKIGDQGTAADARGRHPGRRSGNAKPVGNARSGRAFRIARNSHGCSRYRLQLARNH